jgi:hypothetical protein
MSMMTLSPVRAMRGVTIGVGLFVGLFAGGARPVGAQGAEATRVRSPEASYQAPAATRGSGPNGATMRCKDGSHPAANAPATACASRGGVMFRYPLVVVPTAVPAGETERVIPVPAGARPREGARARGVGSDAATARAGTERGATTVPGPRRAERPPADATLLCGDGTYVRADTASARCGAHGGVKLRLRPRATN